jgi:hypothetical protein
LDKTTPLITEMLAKEKSEVEDTMTQLKKKNDRGLMSPNQAGNVAIPKQ